MYTGAKYQKTLLSLGLSMGRGGQQLGEKHLQSLVQCMIGNIN